MKRSRLDEILGLGHHQQKQLLGNFPSVDYIDPPLAQKIYDYFYPS